MTIEFKFFIFDDPFIILLIIGDILPLLILSLFLIINWQKKRTSETQSKILGLAGIVVLILMSIKFFFPGFTISSPTPEELDIVRIYSTFLAIISPLPYLALGLALLGAEILYSEQRVFKLTYLSASGIIWLVGYILSTTFEVLFNFLTFDMMTFDINEDKLLFLLTSIIGLFALTSFLVASVFLSIYATQHDRKFLRWTSITFISLLMFSGFFSFLYIKLDYIFTHIL